MSPAGWRREHSQHRTWLRPETRTHLDQEEDGVTQNHPPAQVRRVSRGQAEAQRGSWHPSILRLQAGWGVLEAWAADRVSGGGPCPRTQLLLEVPVEEGGQRAIWPGTKGTQCSHHLRERQGPDGKAVRALVPAESLDARLGRGGLWASHQPPPPEPGDLQPGPLGSLPPTRILVLLEEWGAGRGGKGSPLSQGAARAGCQHRPLCLSFPTS